MHFIIKPVLLPWCPAFVFLLFRFVSCSVLSLLSALLWVVFGFVFARGLFGFGFVFVFVFAPGHHGRRTKRNGDIDKNDPVFFSLA